MTDERLQNAIQTDRDTTELLIKVAEGAIRADTAEDWADTLDNGEYTDGAVFIYLYYCAEVGGTIWKVDTVCELEDIENDWEVLNVDIDYEDFRNSVVSIINRANIVEDNIRVGDFGHGAWFFTREGYRRALQQAWRDNGYD